MSPSLHVGGGPRGTPFHDRTRALCRAQNWRRWAGHLAASAYELTHEPEYHAIRSGAGLIDVSPLYKYRLSGPDAVALADRVVTRNVRKCAVGQVLYTPWCDSDGKVRDDGTLHRLDDDELRLTAAEPNLLWLEENAAGLEVSIADETEEVGALALQGPRALAVLRELCGAALDELRFFRVARTEAAGIPVEVSRTGYTGDLGYEIWVRAADAIALWDALTEAGGPHGLLPAGMLALDIARVEAGLILIDVDYVPAHRAVIDLRKSSPYELGLGWTVALDGDRFVGRGALAAEAEREPEWRLRGLEIDWESLETAYREVDLPPQLPSVTVRESVPVYRHGRQAGYATSRCWSPTVKKYIALAHLRTPHLAPGTELEIEVTVEHRRRRARATVVSTPFFDPERKRATPPPAPAGTTADSAAEGGSAGIAADGGSAGAKAGDAE